MNTDTNPGVAAHSAPPYLSIVVTSRNDGHGGSPLTRTQTFLDSLADQCQRHSLNAELVFVEWNPPEDRPRLCHALREPAQPTPLKVRFIEVPAEKHNELANHDKLGLFQMIAKNVGIRRSRGEFVLATNIDILFSEELIAFLARRELKADSFYVVQRHDLGVYDIPDGLRGAELMDFARRNVVCINYQRQSLPADEPPPEYKNGYLHTNGCGDFTLMNRRAWKLSGGYAELQLYSIYIDALVLFSARAAGFRQCALEPPLNTFHIEHGSGWAKDSKAIVASTPAMVHFSDCRPCFYWTVKTGIAPTWNDPDWGYEGVNFRECGFSGNYDAPEPGAADVLKERYRHWIESDNWKRTSSGLIRNTPDDLARLENLVASHTPESIATFGCDDPGRLAALAAGAGNAPVFCFRTGAGTPDQAREFPPAGQSRFASVGGNIATMDFPDELGGKRMFVLIDSTGLTDVEVANVTARILPYLADGSCVLFDNVWHSPQLLLTPEIAGTVFRDRIKPRLTASRPVLCRFAPHYEGGSLIGFGGIEAIAGYVNSRSLHPCLASRRKGIWFIVDHLAKKTEWPGNVSLITDFINFRHVLSDSGEFFYSPLLGVICAMEDKHGLLEIEANRAAMVCSDRKTFPAMKQIEPDVAGEMA